jgi:DNA-binding NtrC family response regulator
MRRRARTDVDGGTGGFSARPGQSGAGTSLIRPRRVLYIERDSFTAAMTRATLEDAGFEVDWFPAADAARAAAGSDPYDVCLLDAHRPGPCWTARLGALATVAGDAGVVLVGGHPSLRTDGERQWVLQRPHAPRMLTAAVEVAARGRREAA